MEGITDNHLFVDHLHPNLAGYFLISEAFYEALSKGIIFSGEKVSNTSTNKAWSELPVTAVDSIYGDWMCKVMKKQWPFYEDVVFDPDGTETYPEKLTKMIFNDQINTDMAMDSLYWYYNNTNRTTEKLKVVESMILEHPYAWRFSSEAANILESRKDFEDAVYYYKKSFTENKSPEVARKIVFDLLQTDKLEDTEQYLIYLLEQQPDDQMTVGISKRIRDVLVFKRAIQNDPNNIEAVFGLADFYLFVGNPDRAKTYIGMIKAKFPKNEHTQKIFAAYQKLTATNKSLLQK
jgi:tetratricopeptide (TPR) repeat protein